MSDDIFLHEQRRRDGALAVSKAALALGINLMLIVMVLSSAEATTKKWALLAFGFIVINVLMTIHCVRVWRRRVTAEAWQCRLHGNDFWQGIVLQTKTIVFGTLAVICVLVLLGDPPWDVLATGITGGAIIGEICRDIRNARQWSNNS